MEGTSRSDIDHRRTGRGGKNQLRAPRQIISAQTRPHYYNNCYADNGSGSEHYDTGIPHVKGETRASAPHTLQCIGDQVPLYAPGVPPVVEQECVPTRDPPQPASIDIGLHVGNDVSLMHVADDTTPPERPHNGRSARK